MKKKDAFIEFLRERDILYTKDNVYHAERAFKTKALMGWFLKQKNKKHFKKYAILIEEFLVGDIDIFIEDDRIVVEEKKKQEQA
jgi:hypothetical protein